jgi:hypothetical protein
MGIAGNNNDNQSMSKPMTYRIMLTITLLLAAASGAHAQRIDTIKANPDAKPLRKIWEVTGGEFGGGRVGDGFGSVSDINGDSLEEWAVHYGDAQEWHIFYGSREELSTTPVIIIDTITGVIAHPIVGDFWGTGHKALAFAQGNRKLQIYRTDSLRLDTIAAAVLDPSTMTPFTTISLQEVLAADLDNDGADELVLISRGVGRGSSLIGRYPEVWIYRGGSGFQVDTPTVILRDAENNGGNGGQTIVIGRADNDDKLDVITVSPYSDGVSKTKFFFGREGSPWNWSEPDRVVAMGGVMPLDCDGDGVLDMMTGGEDHRVSLFLSRSDKDIRIRSFAAHDIDQTLWASTYYCYPTRMGYLSDSSGRFDVLAININGTSYLLSGGPDGPDPYYDAYTGELYGRVIPVGDVNGDGWDEVMTGNYTVNFEAGIALIYAGGPYIPSDPSLGVRAVAGEEHSNAISIWPNPATTELHIAWRGDLKRMPRRFTIHDLVGTLVAQGEVASWRGEALWQCADAPSGAYVLSIMDYRGELITTVRVIKH